MNSENSKMKSNVMPTVSPVEVSLGAGESDITAINRELFGLLVTAAIQSEVQGPTSRPARKSDILEHVKFVAYSPEEKNTSANKDLE